MRHLAAVLALAAVVAGCGEKPEPQPLVVSAASSLKEAFTGYGKSLRDPRFSFAGSDQLAAQIRQGVKPDVFAAANAKLPDALYAEGLVEKPVAFATTSLVLAVPVSGGRLRHLADAAHKGVKLAAGSPGVPVGDYTRAALAGLGQTGKQILANVKTEEPDVKGVIAKITAGVVDAGFVYATDVKAAGGALRPIPLGLGDKAPPILYEAAVVKGAKHHDEAAAFVRGLVDGGGRDALASAGFLPAP